MRFRKALSSARTAATAAALAVAALLVPGTVSASAASGTPAVHVLTNQGIQHARAGTHADADVTGCTIAFPGNIAITPGTTLYEGVSLCSGDYSMAMQMDGNLVIYGPTPGVAIWSSGTANPASTWADMQTDGNFVVYKRNTIALWNTQTWGHAGAYVCFQPDGNLVVYAPESDGQYTCAGTPLWNAAGW